MNTEGIQLRPHKYPSNWEVKQLEEICLQNGLVRGPFGGSLKKEFFTKDGYKVYEQKNAIYRDSEIGSYYIDKVKFNELKRFEVHENDFIVSCSGTIGKIFLMPKGAEPGVINQALLLIKIDRKIINQQFFYSYFEWENFQKSIIDNTQGGAMQNLVGMEIFRKTYIPIPPLPEQRAIAEALSDVDALITSQETLLAKKRAIKQGVMQELLTGKRRLPGYSGEWEEKRLGHIGEFSKGKGLQKDDLDNKGKILAIPYTAIYTDFNEIIKKDQIKNFTSASDTVVINGDHLLIAGSSNMLENIGKTCAYTLHQDVAIGGDIILFKTNANVCFISYLLSTKYHRKRIISLSQGSTIRHVYASTFSDYKIKLPSISEQNNIVDILSTLDAEIDEMDRKIKKMRLLKQGMMQELLTGRIRLTGV
jgi:type I restriction enzyme S subunit